LPVAPPGAAINSFDSAGTAKGHALTRTLFLQIWNVNQAHPRELGQNPCFGAVFSLPK
jgi:hypothetical protein